MKNYLLLILLSFLIFGLSSCEKQENIILEQTHKSQTFAKNNKCVNIDSILNSVNESETSARQDAITFHVANAFQKLIVDNKNLQNTFINSSSIISISNILENKQNLREKLNYYIKESLIKNNLIINSQSSEIAPYINQENFDFLKYFENEISTKILKNKLVLYKVDEIKHNITSNNLFIGVDVILPETTEDVLLLNNSNSYIFSKNDVLNFSNPIVFIGISDMSDIDMKASVKTKKFSKWYHYAKIEWQNCTQDCDVEYQWYTKRRWTSSWKFKQSGSLVEDGDYAEYYYSEYRIKIKVIYNGLSNFSLWEKHWLEDNWVEISY